jgi:GTP1/Obg family GTP-binding protein
VTFNKVERDAYIAFKHLDAYVIYYTPQSKQIVAAEPVASE